MQKRQFQPCGLKWQTFHKGGGGKGGCSFGAKQYMKSSHSELTKSNPWDLGKSKSQKVKQFGAQLVQVAPIIIVMVNISTLALHSNQPIMADLSVLGTGIIETELLVACTLFSSIIIFFWFIFSLQPLRFVQKTNFKCSLQITL